MLYTLIERYYILIFDEISLDVGLQHNPKFDCIDGFVDFGYFERRSKFVDHALVFMLRGIKHKWKQPIYSHFC